MIGEAPEDSSTRVLGPPGPGQRRVLVLERERFPRHPTSASPRSRAGTRYFLERAGVLDKLKQAVAIRKVGRRLLWGRADTDSLSLHLPRPRRQRARGELPRVHRAPGRRVPLDHAGRSEQRCTSKPESWRDAEDRKADSTSAGRRRPARDTRSRGTSSMGQARLLSRRRSLPVVPFDGMNNFAVWAYWKGSGIKREGRPMGDGERWTLISTCDADGWMSYHRSRPR